MIATQRQSKLPSLRWAGDRQGRRCREKKTSATTGNPEIKRTAVPSGRADVAMVCGVLATGAWTEAGRDHHCRAGALTSGGDLARRCHRLRRGCHACQRSCYHGEARARAQD